MGKEHNLETGQILNRNAEWVKTINSDGRIENVNWRPVYQALRTASNTTTPGCSTSSASSAAVQQCSSTAVVGFAAASLPVQPVLICSLTYRLLLTTLTTGL